MALSELQNTLGGVWKYVKSENFDQYLQERGLNLITRKMAASSYPTLTIKVDGDQVVVKTESVRTMENTFKLGEEFQFSDSGTEGKAVATWENRKLIMKLKGNKGEEQIVREIVGGELVQTMTLNGTSCKRYFKHS